MLGWQINMHDIQVYLTTGGMFTLIQLFVLHLKFKFNGVSCIFSGEPLPPQPQLFFAVLILGLSRVRRGIAGSGLAGSWGHMGGFPSFIPCLVRARGWLLSAPRWGWPLGRVLQGSQPALRHSS